MNINETIREVVELTHGEVVKNRVSVRTQLAEGLPLIQADRVQLQQILLNLPFPNQSDQRGPIGEMLTLIGTRDASARSKALAYASSLNVDSNRMGTTRLPEPAQAFRT